MNPADNKMFRIEKVSAKVLKKGLKVNAAVVSHMDYRDRFIFSEVYRFFTFAPYDALMSHTKLLRAMMTKLPAIAGLSVLSATCLLTPALSQSATPSAAPAALTVHMKGAQFDPESATVTVGQTVVFLNDDDLTHNVTMPDRNIASGDIDAGKSWKYTFSTAGTYNYVCTYHSWMKAAITVKT